jgi:hypothetical protein
MLTVRKWQVTLTSGPFQLSYENTTKASIIVGAIRTLEDARR